MGSSLQQGTLADCTKVACYKPGKTAKCGRYETDEIKGQCCKEWCTGHKLKVDKYK